MFPAHRQTTVKSVAAAVLLAGAATVGCDTPEGEVAGDPAVPAVEPVPTVTTTSPAAGNDAAHRDYSQLLLQASDISDDEDTFTVRSTSGSPGGLPGASALFVNAEDTRAISDTVVVYPDAATATATLRNALPAVEKTVVGGTPRPAPVGTDGTIVVGMSAEGPKAATLLIYTHGPALVRLHFESAPGDATTDEFVFTVGKMQLIALRTGLTGEE
ncbi:hypothetical protein [Mycolicibacterium monacense]|uniref:hypothetical protein n=1 Tax=Mycolicibacterium monacense TaxID=85693 RepID=UPI0007EAA2F0|nr:hypothetical protein [Mycolicibacterium monacense]OBB62758.1 hypothetical protein A6B34_25925 [Mycolicibacterium monacense]